MKMMEINPCGPIDMEIAAPPSKSYTNRALLISALADGKSVLKNPLISDDTNYMTKALGQIGVKIKSSKDGFVVHGVDGELDEPIGEIFVGNAGTAMRFLTGALSLVNGKSVITGNDGMKKRPLEDLLDGLRQLGVVCSGKNGFPPVVVEGKTLRGGTVRMKGENSSQYFSSIMMVAPYAKEDVILAVDGSLTSKSYIDITTDIMKKFSVSVDNDDYQRFTIPVGGYKSCNYLIEGDASSASYLFGASAITSGKVKVTNLNPKSVQGDIKFVDVLEKMGCNVSKGKDSITLEGGDLKGISIDMNLMPDTVQTLAVVALFARGKTTIKNISNLRIKETDRISALACELSKLGAKVTAKKDSLTIVPARDYNGTIIDTYDDHRMAMSFSLAGLKIPGVKIKNPECVSKSYPHYWEDFAKLTGGSLR